MVSALKVDVSDTDLMTLYAGGTADDHVVWTAGHHRVLEPRVLNTSVLHVRFISGLWMKRRVRTALNIAVKVV
nr:hypothetical protein BaRGS_006652 [Batillaria attramentaria]